MPFPVLGSNSAVAEFSIDNAITFNDDSTAYLNRTRSSQSNTTGTFSVWTKMGNVNVDNVLFGGATDVNNRSYIYFSDPDGFVGIFSRTSGSADIAYNSNAKFRDPSAWYHVVVAIDTTQGTAGNRFKMYINGTQFTDWGTATAPSQNASLPILNQAAQTVGGGFGASSISTMAEGYMADAYYIDGQQLAPTDFGEFNDNGVWIPKAYDGSYGTNGFKLEFQDSGNLGDDTSGNGNDFTANGLGTYSQGTDTPTNNFCTLNPLAQNPNLLLGLAGGNTQSFDTNNGDFRPCGATMCFTKGKWYFETKYSGAGSLMVGLFDADNSTAQAIWSGTGDRFAGYNSGGNGFSYRNNGTLYTNGNTTSGKTSWSSNGDFLGLAIDCDNNAIYAHVNGTYVDSGDPTSGASRTGSLSNFTQTGFMMPMISVSAASFNGGYHNFGNPVNNDSGVTNSNTDANGYGQFQYAVPSGYYSLCTKNLAEYG